MELRSKGSFSLLYKYVAKEFILSFIVAFFFFFFIFFVNQILLYAQRILIKNVPISQMFLLVSLSMPQIMLYTIPFSTLSAASMVIGDLSANNETLALRAAGISLFKMFRSIIIGAMLMSAVTFLIADFLIPYSNTRFKTLYSSLLRDLPTMEIEPYSINTIGDVSIVTGEVVDGVMNSVFIFDQSNKKDKQIISAVKGEITLIDISSFIYRLDLYDVLFLTNDSSNKEEFSYASGEKMTYYLNFSSQMGQITDMSPSKMTSRELLNRIKEREIEFEKLRLTLYNRKMNVIEEKDSLLASPNKDENDIMEQIEKLNLEIQRIEREKPIDFYLQYYRAEFHKKIALSISSLILALIAFPLSFMKIKHGRLFGFGLSLLVAALYWTMLFIGQSQIIRVAIHPLFFMWAPNAIILLISLSLLLKNETLMRVLRRYLLVSFFRLVTITTLLLSFILLLFDLFSHLEQYLQAEVALMNILYATVLYFPEAIVFAIPPSSLFASTYILSMMHTHNEMIILNNSGISFKRLVSILIIASLFLSLFQFAFNEEITIKANRMKNDYTQEILDQSITSDNRNITLYGFDRSYIIYARRFTEIDNRITQVSLYHLDKDGSLLERVDATTGVYDEGSWTLQNANIYSIENNEATFSFLSSYNPAYFTLEPSFFANKNNEVITMDLSDALRYIESIKLIRKSEYSLIASDIYNRIFKNFAPLILILISCSTVFAWKKNVLMLSIIMSISIAVVFYVMLLMGMILAKQGVIQPIMGTLGPMVILFFASILTLSFKRK